MADGLTTLNGHVNVERHDQHAGDPEEAADKTYKVSRGASFDGLDKGVHQSAVRVDRTPH